MHKVKCRFVRGVTWQFGDWMGVGWQFCEYRVRSQFGEWVPTLLTHEGGGNTPITPLSPLCACILPYSKARTISQFHCSTVSVFVYFITSVYSWSSTPHWRGQGSKASPYAPDLSLVRQKGIFLRANDIANNTGRCTFTSDRRLLSKRNHGLVVRIDPTNTCNTWPLMVLVAVTRRR